MFERFNKIKKAGTALSVAEVHDQRLGPYLTKHDIPTNGHRREHVTNRVLLMVSGLFAAVSILEAVALVEMLPLYKVVPFFVTFSDKADQVVRIEPPSGRLNGIGILAEQTVKDYVTMRNTITADASETIDRWGGRLRLMSSDEVYSDFLKETRPIYDQLRSGNFTRTISIRSLLDKKDGLYDVEFDAYDHHQGTGLSDTSDTKTTYTAQVRMVLATRHVSFDQRNLNPLGFTVTEYSVARKRN